MINKNITKKSSIKEIQQRYIIEIYYRDYIIISNASYFMFATKLKKIYTLYYIKLIYDMRIYQLEYIDKMININKW